MSPGPWHSERHLGKMVMESGRCSACLMPSFDWSVCREKGCAALKVRVALEGWHEVEVGVYVRDGDHSAADTERWNSPPKIKPE